MFDATPRTYVRGVRKRNNLLVVVAPLWFIGARIGIVAHRYAKLESVTRKAKLRPAWKQRFDKCRHCT